MRRKDHLSPQGMRKRQALALGFAIFCRMRAGEIYSLHHNVWQKKKNDLFVYYIMICFFTVLFFFHTDDGKEYLFVKYYKEKSKLWCDVVFEDPFFIEIFKEPVRFFGSFANVKKKVGITMANDKERHGFFRCVFGILRLIWDWIR